MEWASRPCAGRRPTAMSSATWRTRNPKQRSTTTRRWKRPWLSPRSVRVDPSAAHAHARGQGAGECPPWPRDTEACLFPCAHRRWRGLCAWWLSPARDPVPCRLTTAGCCWQVLTPRGHCAASKQPSQDILDHQAKRRVELKLMEFRVAMEVCSRRLISLRRLAPGGGRLPAHSPLR